MPLDDFNRADNTSLGTSWQEVEDTADLQAIVANELNLKSDGSGRAFAYWATDLGGDHYSQLEFRSVNMPAVKPRSGPAVRIQTTSTLAAFTGYVCLYDPGAGRLSLLKFVGQDIASGGTVLGTAAVTLTTGDTVRIEALGSSVRVLRNGAQVISVTDASISGGRPGFVVDPGYMI